MSIQPPRESMPSKAEGDKAAVLQSVRTDLRNIVNRIKTIPPGERGEIWDEVRKQLRNAGMPGI